MNDIKRVKAADVKDAPVAEARVEPQVGLAAEAMAAAAPAGPAFSPGQQPNQPAINPVFIKQMEAKFDAAKDAATNAKFEVTMTGEAIAYLLDRVMKDAEWKGLSSYPVVKVTDDLSELVQNGAKTSTDGHPAGNIVRFTFNGDLLEATFHFVNNHVGRGYDEAKLHAEVSGVLVKPFNTLNDLRKKMREAALELQAAEAGMTVDELMVHLHAQQQS